VPSALATHLMSRILRCLEAMGKGCWNLLNAGGFPALKQQHNRLHQRSIVLVVGLVIALRGKFVPAHHTIDGVTYGFRDLRTCLLKRTPARAGDELCWNCCAEFGRARCRPDGAGLICPSRLF